MELVAVPHTYYEMSPTIGGGLRLRAWLILMGVLLLVAACTCRDDAAPIQSPAPDATPSQTGAQPEYISAPMRVVTLAGAPLPGMMPIATLQPNAFDAPVATGALTDANGESRLRFPIDQKVALRAWDKTLLYFPNNFYEVLPGSGNVQDALVVSMVESASIEAVLFAPDGAPVTSENVGIMLFHPVHGPWWPAEANSDDRGNVIFYRVPPGRYVMRVKIASGASVEIPETYIAPGETTHIGPVYLQ